ncbi:MAG: hypothetical protein IKC42_05835 [Alistipes sp.]|nr:hypothetical protein [Alistipes sp.]
MKYLLTLLFIAMYGISARATAQTTRIVCDDTCKTESGATPVKGDGFTVVSPVGQSTVKMIDMAPRLNSLDGKTIAIVGGSFMARTTHPEIKRLIEQHYPSARVILLDEIGSAGVYPAPGVTRRSKDEFQERLRSMQVDAVISGNCGCGLCTPKEVGSCIAAEYIGIPAVAIAAPTFTEQVFYTSTNNGIPAPRVAEYPGAFASHTTEELIKNTRNVLWPQIVKALTTPISAEELARSTNNTPKGLRDDIFHGSLQEVNDFFCEMNWSDGLPITPPTFEKVSEFLQYTDKAWDETVAILPVAHRNTTVWHVAVNGVMAGCKPEYMPILIAMTKALGAPEFRRTLASTHAWVPYSWLNGPIARQLGIDCSQGEINEAANLAIGRFMSLALMNLAGYYVKQNRMGTFGYPMPWCLVEDESACREVGWKPHHERLGFKPHDSTITVCSTLIWGNNMAPSTTNPQKIMELLAWDITERCQFALGSGKQFTYRTILLTKPIAKNLAAKYRTPHLLEQDLIRTARRPLHERLFANYYANPGSNPEERHPIRNWRGHLLRSESAAMTPTPVWHDSKESQIMTIPTMKEGMTAFIITGDESRNKVQTMPGGGFKTIRIELPHNWDTLMQKRGYRPLSEFYIE